MGQRKRSIVQVRISSEDAARVETAARQDHRSVSAWIRNLMLKEIGGLVAHVTRRARPRRMRR